MASGQGFEATLLAIDPHDPWPARHLLGESELDTGDVDFPLLLDPAQVVSASYGVAFQMNIHVERSNRPATFIVDEEGVLRYAKRATAFADRPDGEEIRAELEKLSDG